MKTIKLFLFGLALVSTSYAQSKVEAKSHFDNEKWVEYIEGNIPLVISVPHGGRVTVDSLPIRDCKDAVTGVDSYTIELAKAIQVYFEKTYNKTPHIILSHIARKHVDQNRELENGGACGYKQNEKPWYSFHNFVDSALTLASLNGQRVMYIDLHGHGHTNQRLEMGYNLTANELDAALAGRFDHTKKNHSLTNLLAMDSQLDFKSLIFGENSFGTFAVNNGLPAVPSKQDLAPAKGEKFFSGGDNTRRFTSKKYPFSYGLQIECDAKSRKLENRKASAKTITEAIVQYMNLYGKAGIALAKQ